MTSRGEYIFFFITLEPMKTEEHQLYIEASSNFPHSTYDSQYNMTYLKRLKPSIALNGKPRQSYGASLAIWDHTRHKWTRLAITPANQAGTRFTYPGGRGGWVDIGSPIAVWPGIEPTTAWSQVRRPNRYATESNTTAWSLSCRRAQLDARHHYNRFYQLRDCDFKDLIRNNYHT